jgi:hypothetical protein
MSTPFHGCPICLFVQDSKTRIWHRLLPESSLNISGPDLRELICNRFGNTKCINTTPETSEQGSPGEETSAEVQSYNWIQFLLSTIPPTP